ncbi:MAG TPA: Lrp/AsnC ligand binding domain-containing protein [Saprospiraceae bacterium]|nr:Lrp/AsnC ligand binding domain-containing protein [Saprospiraceae bacterium]
MNKKIPRREIDHTDLQIISILTFDSKTPYAEIGERIGVAAGTVHGRIKKMIDLGIVTGSKLSVEYSRLGYDICAFLGIYLKESSMYDRVSIALKKIPEVVEAHYTTGVYSIFVKVLCRDTEHLRRVLSNKIQKIEGIQRTETFISLHESINRPLLMDEISIPSD